MIDLNLPKFEAKILSKKSNLYIWDIIRKKYIKLNPEEWVRQNFVNYLVNHLDFPISLIANEVELTLNNTTKRADSVIYGEYGEPIALIEYKSPNIKLNQETFNQIYRYNIVFKVSHLIVSNGLNHYCCHIDLETKQVQYLSEIPTYADMLKNLKR